MPAEDQGPYEPLPEFISETADEVIRLAPAAGISDKSNLQAMLTRFTSFEASEPIDQGYERIIITKDKNWVPASGHSVKLGNLRFNLGTLLEAIASGVSAGFTIATPILAIFTGLVAIRQLVRAAKVDLSEREALVIWSIWSCEQRGKAATTEEIRQVGIQEAARVGSTLQPSTAEVEQSLNRLEKIGAILDAGEGSWETREAVIVQT
jgi:hypothetical protein